MDAPPPVSDADLAATPASVLALVQWQARQIAQLQREIAELKARLNKDSTNSSLPPLATHPHAKPIVPKPKSKRRRGGQPGHAKHERALIPVEDCHSVVPCVPTDCRKCGRALHGADPEPLRHQVWELPEIKPIVTEYQRHRLVCTCGCSTCGDLPAGVPSGAAGPRLVAFSGLLMACFRQSKRRDAQFLGIILNQPASAAWMVLLQNCCAEAVKPAYDELAAKLPNEPVKKHLGHDLMRPTKELFNLWKRVRDGTISRATFERNMQPIRQRIDALLLRGYYNNLIYNFCKELWEHRDNLWTFVEVEGVEPTNNAAERALRHAVIWRKLSFGTQSAAGSRFVERLLTVVETSRRQGRDVFAWLTEAVQAHMSGHQAPSLLPEA